MEDFQVQDYILNSIRKHAQSSRSKEVCGVIINTKGKLLYKECRNLAIDPNNFIIDPVDFIKAESLGSVEYIVHSHIHSSAEATEADAYSCNKGSVPWLIYAVASDTFNTIYPKNTAIKIVGRAYSFGTFDCWGLVCDVLKEEKGIVVGRALVADPLWYKTGFNVFEDNAEAFGFNKVSKADIKPYDILLFKAGNTKVPNHCGILHNNNTFIHHLTGRLSTKEVYGGYWQQYTHSIYRHNEL